jgi:hypothetical protein
MTECICKGFYKPTNCPAHSRDTGDWILKEDSNLLENVHAVAEPTKAGERPVLRVSPEMMALIRHLHAGTYKID